MGIDWDAVGQALTVLFIIFVLLPAALSPRNSDKSRKKP
jgi:hypothetical protein